MRHCILIFALVSLCATAHAEWELKILHAGLRDSMPVDTIDSLTFPIEEDPQIEYLRITDKNKTQRLRQRLENVLAIVPSADATSENRWLLVDTGGGMFCVTLDSIDNITFDYNTEGTDTDWDGDGLSNTDEMTMYSTDPRKADTDGDGWDDNVEITQFDANSPLRFNPLVADLPRYTIEFATAPRIDFNYTTSSNEQKTSSHELASSTSQSSTTASSYAASTALERTWNSSVTSGIEVGTKVGAEVGAGLGLSSETSFSYHHEWTNEHGGSSSRNQSHETSRSQCVETAREARMLESRQTSEGITINGAKIAFSAKVRNAGSIGFTLNNTSYSIYSADQRTYSFVPLVANASVNQSMTLAPDAVSQPFSIEATLTLDEAKAFLGASDGVVCRMAQGAFTTVDNVTSQTIDFSSIYTKTSGRTASLGIDFGPASGRSPINVRVATLYKYNQNHTSLYDMYTPPTLGELLRQMRIEYVEEQVGPHTGLSTIDGVACKPQERAHWFITVFHRATDELSFYSVYNGSFSLDSIKVHTNEVVDIVFSTDKDGDGVPVRQELIVGSVDTLTDTDGDGLSDSTEIFGWPCGSDTCYTDPAKADTDGDGVTDPNDSLPTQFQLHASADIHVLYVKERGQTWSNATVRRENIVSDITLPRVTLAGDSVDVAILTEEPVSRVTVNGRVAPEEYNAGYPIENARWIIRILATVGSSNLAIRVISEDGSDTLRATVPMVSRLAAPDWLTFAPQSDATHSTVKAGVKYNNVRDSRVHGIVLLRSTDRAAMSSLTIPDSTVSRLSIATIDSLEFFAAALGFEDTAWGGLDFRSMHYYRAAGYTFHDNRYYYSAPSRLDSAATGGQLKVRYEIPSFRCLNEGDGTGLAEIGMHQSMDVAHDTVPLGYSSSPYLPPTAIYRFVYNYSDRWSMSEVNDSSDRGQTYPVGLSCEYTASMDSTPLFQLVLDSWEDDEGPDSTYQSGDDQLQFDVLWLYALPGQTNYLLTNPPSTQPLTLSGTVNGASGYYHLYEDRSYQPDSTVRTFGVYGKETSESTETVVHVRITSWIVSD